MRSKPNGVKIPRASRRKPGARAKVDAGNAGDGYGLARARREQAAAIRAEIQVERESLDLARQKSNLVPIAEVREKFFEVVTVAKTKLLGLATRCRQRMPHLSAADVRLIDDLVREALDGLAEGKEIP